MIICKQEIQMKMIMIMKMRIKKTQKKMAKKNIKLQGKKKEEKIMNKKIMMVKKKEKEKGREKKNTLMKKKAKMKYILMIKITLIIIQKNICHMSISMINILAHVVNIITLILLKIIVIYLQQDAKFVEMKLINAHLIFIRIKIEVVKLKRKNKNIQYLFYSYII